MQEEILFDNNRQKIGRGEHKRLLMVLCVISLVPSRQIGCSKREIVFFSLCKLFANDYILMTGAIWVVMEGGS